MGQFVCWKCGTMNTVALKSHDGDGRRDAYKITRLNYLKRKILGLFIGKAFPKLLDNNELTDFVVTHIKKLIRGKEVGEYGPHDRKVIMTEVSFLLGLDLVSLIKEKNPELADTETYEWQVKGFRGYWQTEDQRRRAIEILEREGYLEPAKWERVVKARDAKKAKEHKTR